MGIYNSSRLAYIKRAARSFARQPRCLQAPEPLKPPIHEQRSLLAYLDSWALRERREGSPVYNTQAMVAEGERYQKGGFVLGLRLANGQGGIKFIVWVWKGLEGSLEYSRDPWEYSEGVEVSSKG